MNNEKQLKRLFNFIDESPTCFHAVANLENMLDKEGFVKLDEKDVWEIEKKGKYYVNRNDSSLIAFVLPEKKA